MALIKVNCSRCGKEITATNKALHPSLQALKDKTGYLCADCITPEERFELNRAIGLALRRQLSNKVR